MALERVYKFNTKQFINYEKNDKYDIGDVLIGKGRIVCITHNDLKLLEHNYCWGPYLRTVTEMLKWDNQNKLNIYTNNNNVIFRHTSISTINDQLSQLLGSLQKSFRVIEVC